MNHNIKTYLKLIIVAVLVLISTTNVGAQQVCSFDGKEILKSNDGEFTFDFHSVRNAPELTAGIIGKGLRTDGYSTWLSVKTEQLKNLSGISGWFALESFPTDTAAFFVLKDNLDKTSIAICVDRFGELLIGTGVENKFSYYSTKQYVERFRWINLAFSIAKRSVSFWINGKEVDVNKLSASAPSRITDILIAKDIRTKKEWITDLTLINGIVDELKLWSSPINVSDLQHEISELSSKTPVLAVPESRFEGDFSRPKYHLLPAANWTNETHGLILYNNKYHIFNQKNASSLMLRQINWGHFSSPDLIHWTEHKPALTPEPGYDQNGIWSGCAVLNDQGIPAILYTAGGEKMGIGIAFPKDSNLIEWKKYEGNPVIPGQPKGYTRTDLRDTYAWKEGDKWYMAVGFGVEKDGVEKGAVLLYTSPDLKKWDFVHTLFEGNPDVDNSGIFWEMPVFKKIGQKYVLLINKVPHNGVPARAMYWVGDFKNEKFIPDDQMPKNLEVINRLLSPSVTIDKEGQITAIAIIPDEIGGEAAYQHGWTHLYSIPRVWNLKDGKILQTPHPALKELREKHNSFQNAIIENDKALLISENNQQIEIQATIEPDGSKKYGFIINKNRDNSEYTKLYYDAEKHEMVVDQSHSSLKKYIPLKVRNDKYYLDPSKRVNFHIFIDGSVVEVFINNEDAFTTRVFPLKPNSNQIEIFTDGGNIKASADVWQLKPAPIKTDF
ncbi:MAG: GH32 C-terminal domain-containing protein [Bacteroidota bacterium]|nr:GH32 C-terminal domain-containing protein [Bacteroidota bacterium]